MTSAEFSPLPDPAEVFRLAEVGKGYFPDPSKLPLPDFFAPSTEDRAEAAARHRRVALSVWNREITAVAQARRIRWGEAADAHETRTFLLEAAAVREVGRALALPLDAVRDPHDDAVEGPGASGHCAILGLDSAEQAGPKAAYKQARRTLAESCRPLS